MGSHERTAAAGVPFMERPCSGLAVGNSERGESPVSWVTPARVRRLDGSGSREGSGRWSRATLGARPFGPRMEFIPIRRHQTGYVEHSP